MVSIELKNLAKSFNRRPIFDGVNAVIESGHALVIAGANGSGKSTLIRLICGLLRPSKGEVVVTLDGKAASPAAARRHFGLVAPDVALYGELTALENMAFFARVRGLPVQPERCEALLDRLGLAGRGDDEARTYSSGMRHRLKYACALLHEPAILLLDEPTSNLDEDGIAIVREVMAEQKGRGILIFATNDPQETALGNTVLRLVRPPGPPILGGDGGRPPAPPILGGEQRPPLESAGGTPGVEASAGAGQEVQALLKSAGQAPLESAGQAAGVEALAGVRKGGQP